MWSVDLNKAYQAREALFQEFEEDKTDTYRLFHGASEGRPGVTIDRYGSLLLAQTSQDALSADDCLEIEKHYRELLGFDFQWVYNHRAKKKSQPFSDWHQVSEEALEPVICQELGHRYYVEPRHQGIDPYLFLDMRVGRRFLAKHCQGKSFLNLFSYTCSLGVVAAKAGASKVWNVDFSKKNLDVGEINASLNEIEMSKRFRMINEDVIPIVRQLAGLSVRGKAQRRSFMQIQSGQYDVVFLDPPRWAKSRFGAIDLVRDYQSLFKPALISTSDNGLIIATNHVPQVDLNDWLDSLKRCAKKLGRPIQQLEVLKPEIDFPSFDGNPPLKIALCYI